MAGIEERMSLDAAIKKALAKERAERGLVDEVPSTITYIAHLDVNKKLLTIRNTDLVAFLITATKYQAAFPAIPMHLFTHTELQSDQSTKVV